MRRQLIFSSVLLVMVIMNRGLSAQIMSDSLGFVWDFGANGSVEDGSDDAFDGGMLLTVDGSPFQGTGPGVQQDKMLVFGPETMAQGISVTRHILLLQDPPGLFYADSFKNTSDQKKSFRPNLYSDFGESAPTESRSNTAGRTRSFIFKQPGPRPSIVFHYGESSDEYLPSVNGNGDTYTFDYPPLNLNPQEERTIGFFVAQRQLGAGRTVFEDETIFSRCVDQVAQLKDFSFVNRSGMGIYNTGNLALTPQVSSAFIQTRRGGKVFGDLKTTFFELETEIGKRKMFVEQIVNLIKAEDDQFSIIGNDGSILTGTLKPKRIEFVLSDGGSGEIAIQDIARLVPPLVGNPPKKSEAGNWFKFSSPILIFASGERIAGELVDDAITVSSSLGQLQVPIKTLSSIQFGKNGSAGFNAMFNTKDGQRFSGGFFGNLKLKIWDGSIIRISAGNLAAIHLEAKPDRKKGEKAEHALLELGRSEILYTKILAEKKPLEFATDFGVRHFSPEQIFSLSSKPGLSEEMLITLWDGSELQGKLTSDTVLFELLDNDVEIASSLIRSYKNPLCLPPQEICDRYIETINQLASEKFSVRNTAMKQLQKDAHKIRGLLKSQMKIVDVETKARIWKLLPEEDRVGQRAPKNQRHRDEDEQAEIEENEAPLDEPTEMPDENPADPQVEN